MTSSSITVSENASDLDLQIAAVLQSAEKAADELADRVIANMQGFGVHDASVEASIRSDMRRTCIDKALSEIGFARCADGSIQYVGKAEGHAAI